MNNNHIVSQYCKMNPEVCLDPGFRSRKCGLFPFQAMKILRLSFNLTKLLLDDSDLDLRVLLLIRDPRGTMQSRLRRPWCRGRPDCDDPHIHCSDLEADFHAAVKLSAEYPGRLMALRYEDMSLNPYSATKKIFKFFRLPYHSDVQNYLDDHTTFNHGGFVSTFRDSKTTPFHWRNDFLNNFEEVERIQSHCENAMTLWGYRPAKDKDDMMEYNPVLKPPWKEIVDCENE